MISYLFDDIKILYFENISLRNIQSNYSCHRLELLNFQMEQPMVQRGTH